MPRPSFLECGSRVGIHSSFTGTPLLRARVPHYSFALSFPTRPGSRRPSTSLPSDTPTVPPRDLRFRVLPSVSFRTASVVPLLGSQVSVTGSGRRRDPDSLFVCIGRSGPLGPRLSENQSRRSGYFRSGEVDDGEKGSSGLEVPSLSLSGPERVLETWVGCGRLHVLSERPNVSFFH